MVKPVIDPVTQDITCPTCQQSQFTVFRRDPEGPGCSLNHCKCVCGQLFVYHVDDSNQPVLDPEAFLATQLNERIPSDRKAQAICCPRCKGAQFTVFRRERSGRQTLLHYARCLACGEHFTYTLNRASQLVARPA